MDLKFDEMAVDTTLAQDFLKKESLSAAYERARRPLHFDGKAWWDSFNACSFYGRADISEKLRNLAQKLKENMQLFAQLEFLNREIPIEDTNVQVNLLIQQLYYVSSTCVNEVSLNNEMAHELYMHTEAPLLLLGFAIRSYVYFTPRPSVICSRNTSAISYLFSKLCYSSEITIVTEIGREAPMCHIRPIELGGVGVISESSDLDSAVDVLMTSSKKAPWSLRRILVQESVYQKFKDALTWKCNLNRPTATPTPDVLKYKGRKFLLDSVGNRNPKPTKVAVEAYRTRKELLSLLDQYRPHYLSLWANDIAEINEITYSVKAPVVWVNNFADFRGPPRISESIYSTDSFYDSWFEHFSEQGIDKLKELQRSWLKLDVLARYEILRSTVDKIAADNKDNPFYAKVKDIVQKLDFGLSSFVYTGIDYVCIGIPTPTELVGFFHESSPLIDEAYFLKAILRGNILMFNPIDPCDLSHLIDALKIAGAPVSTLEQVLHPGPEDDDDNYNVYLPRNELFDISVVTRVIWTNSGTIFAN